MRAVHPGEILKEGMEDFGLNAHQLAKALRVPPNRITAILKERRGITADTALRLSKYFGTTAQYWLNLQTGYDLRVATRALSKELRRIETIAR